MKAQEFLLKTQKEQNLSRIFVNNQVMPDFVIIMEAYHKAKVDSIGEKEISKVLSEDLEYDMDMFSDDDIVLIEDIVNTVKQLLKQ